MTSRPELSVVIVSYRCASQLEACLESLDTQRGSVSLEIIVVDNASGDGTPDVARHHDGVRLIECSGNSGFARAANQGLNRAHGEFLLILNPDTIVPAGSLRACVDEMKRHPAVGVLTARIVDESGDTDLRCHRSFPTWWSATCFITGLDQILPPRIGGSYLRRDIPDNVAADVDAVSGAFMLVPRNALIHVGGFDQQFFMYAEDIDLCMRFGAAGFRVRYWPGVSILHSGGASSRHPASRDRARAAAYRTMAPLIRKHRRGARGALFAGTAIIAGEVLLALRRLADSIGTSR